MYIYKKDLIILFWLEEAGCSQAVSKHIKGKFGEKTNLVEKCAKANRDDCNAKPI